MTSLFMPIRGLKRRGFTWNARMLVKLGRELERIGLTARWTIHLVHAGPNSLPSEAHEIVELKFDTDTEATAFRTISSLVLSPTKDAAEAWLQHRTGQPFN